MLVQKKKRGRPFRGGSGAGKIDQGGSGSSLLVVLHRLNRRQGVGSRLLDSFINPVAALGEIDLNYDSMLYAGFVKHSKFDRLKRIDPNDPFPTGFHG